MKGPGEKSPGSFYIAIEYFIRTSFLFVSTFEFEVFVNFFRSLFALRENDDKIGNVIELKKK